MLKGVGLDLCQIERFKEHLTAETFLKKIFSAAELAYCLNQADSASSLAARFAAKESLIKALSPAKVLVELKFLEVALNEDGSPYWLINNELEALLKQARVNRLHLSLSHEAGVAVAITIAE